MAEPTVIAFQGTERRPIIGLRSVPPSPENGLPYPGAVWVTVTICLLEDEAVFYAGILVLTLGSLWYWEMGAEVVQHRLSTPSGCLLVIGQG